MIVSHKYKFIFIKTHKTAGSSMEMALGPLCGADDVIPSMETNLDSGVPRNYHEPTWIGRTYASSRLFRKLIHRHSPLLGNWYYEHMAATRVRELIGEDVWNSYYKFCFERNPWAKVVSYYNWKTIGQGRKLPPFDEWVLQKSHRLPRDADLYFDGQTCLMDDVFDFDNFRGTFQSICDRLGIPFNGEMPREKTNITKEKPRYQDFYSDETREKVASLYQREIELMGYSFEPLTASESSRVAA